MRPLKSQLADHEKIDASLRAMEMEKANETLRAQIQSLRATRDRMLDGVYRSKKAHLPDVDDDEALRALAPPPGQLESPIGQSLVAAIRQYHEAKKRGPKSLEDLAEYLTEDVKGEVARTTGLYEKARKHVTSSNYSAGAKKRKGGPVAASDHTVES